MSDGTRYPGVAPVYYEYRTRTRLLEWHFWTVRPAVPRLMPAALRGCAVHTRPWASRPSNLEWVGPRHRDGANFRYTKMIGSVLEAGFLWRVRVP